MPRPETRSFSSLLTSLGLVCLAASLVIPYFFFRSTDTLRIPEKELSSLTEVGRTTLENRQQRISDLEPFVAFGSIALAVIGLILVVLGGRLLLLFHRGDEEERELRRKKSRFEWDRLSEERIAQKQEQEAKASADEAGDRDSAADADEAPTEAQRRAAAERRRNLIKERQASITRVEAKIQDVLIRQTPADYDYIPNLVVSGMDSKIELDGLFEGTDGDVVLEVKVGSSMALIRRFWESWRDDALARIARYEGIAGDVNAWAWLVVVLADGADEERDERFPSTGRNPMAGRGAITFILERDLHELPARFEQVRHPR